MESDFPFDPTYGYSKDRLLEVPAPAAPADFEAFWRDTFAENRRINLDLTRAPGNLAAPAHEVLEVSFCSLGGVRISGWALIPKSRSITCAFVISHGYGGRDAPELVLPAPDAAAIFPCARGLSRSVQPGIPASSERHVMHGIKSRDTYIHRGCAADIWSAASALIELAPEAARRLYYLGGSFGGGIGALSLPWDARFKKAFLSVPSFGNHPLRLQMECVGSGESVRRYHLKHPEIAGVLRYFDAATAATFIRIPTLVAPALFDPAVPPPGQFAVYNAITAPKELFVQSCGHFEYAAAADEAAALQARVCNWFREE